jgi:cell division protein FtsI (penicillin-binding protein 3)
VKRARPVIFNHNPLLQLDLPPWRARAVLLALFAGMLALAGRSLYLQVIHNEFLQKEGADRYVRVISVPAIRGQITDRHGEMLAVSAEVYTVLAAPGEARQLEPGQLRQLAQLLGLSVSEISNRISSALGRDSITLKRQLPPEAAGRIAALQFPGIRQQKEYRRFYPGGDVNSHLLGVTNIDDRGQEGIELAYDKLLAGQAGSRRVIKDLRGRVVYDDTLAFRPPRDGQDIVLAMDTRIQYLAYTALHEAVQRNQARAGAVVVVDVRTGEVLALVNAPTFNPNNRANLVGAQLPNRVFTDPFEPGSVMKPFTVAMALESGQFKSSTPIDTSPGRMTISGREISDSRPHGILTVAEVIQKSSNIGTAKIALQFPAEDMWKLYSRLGFGARLNLGFPGESRGRLPPAKGLRPVEQATMSYGHGMSVTLIQIARAYLAFARDGELLPLSLTRVDTPPTPVQVFSPAVAREMRKMLEAVVGPGGTAARAHVAGYRVAGKTGTANKIEGGQYVKKYVSSFVGFAPVSNPRLIVAVMIDDPSASQHLGGAVAAPVFAKVVEGSLRALGVAPDAPVMPLQLSALSLDGGEGASVPWGDADARP